MPLTYWCLLIAGLLPYAWALVAKLGLPDNHRPRGCWRAQKAIASRANWAQANAFESLPLFYRGGAGSQPATRRRWQDRQCRAAVCALARLAHRLFWCRPGSAALAGLAVGIGCSDVFVPAGRPLAVIRRPIVCNACASQTWWPCCTAKPAPAIARCATLPALLAPQPAGYTSKAGPVVLIRLTGKHCRAFCAAACAAPATVSARFALMGARLAGRNATASPDVEGSSGRTPARIPDGKGRRCSPSCEGAAAGGALGAQGSSGQARGAPVRCCPSDRTCGIACPVLRRFTSRMSSSRPGAPSWRALACLAWAMPSLAADALFEITVTAARQAQPRQAALAECHHHRPRRAGSPPARMRCRCWRASAAWKLLAWRHPTAPTVFIRGKQQQPDPGAGGRQRLGSYHQRHAALDAMPLAAIERGKPARPGQQPVWRRRHWQVITSSPARVRTARPTCAHYWRYGSDETITHAEAAVSGGGTAGAIPSAAGQSAGTAPSPTPAAANLARPRQRRAQCLPAQPPVTAGPQPGRAICTAG